MGRVISSWSELRDLLQKQKSSRVVFTNGCFDILHVGHVRYLQEARQLGDLLVLGLNSDSSVRKLKGPTRPVNDELSRAEVLAALACVDFVTIFSEDTPEKLIEFIRPKILVKGGDWKPEQIAGGKFVLSIGGEVKSLQFVDGFSTTQTIEKAASQERSKS